jgi:transposase
MEFELREATEKPRPRLKLINRDQRVLRPMNVERLVPEDHEVRAVWEFAGRMDLSGYYEEIEAVEGEAGRCAMDPRLTISLWIDAYSKGVSSAREISRLCESDSAYQWLTGIESIHYPKLSDFRVDHKEALDELFTQVLGLLSAEGLISLERVMHDGGKMKACASADTFRREEKIRAHLGAARQQVEQMGDPWWAEEVSSRVAKARQRAVREKQQRLEMALQELEKVRGSKSGMEAKAIYRQRGAVSEFPNAWIKDKIGLHQFRLRGLVKVGTEALWACLTHNIKQWIRLCGRPQWA